MKPPKNLQQYDDVIYTQAAGPTGGVGWRGGGELGGEEEGAASAAAGGGQAAEEEHCPQKPEGEPGDYRPDDTNVSVQIERDLEEVLGTAAVATYQTWVQDRELWVTKERQAQERLQLAREELARLRRGLASQPD